MPCAEVEAPSCARSRGEIDRPRVAAWFEAAGHAAVRIVVAPLGAGKTLALKHYAARHPERVAYVRVPAGADRAALQRMLDDSRPADEVILDGADRAAPEAYQELVDDIAEGAVRPRLILAGRSRRRLHAHALLARGLATAFQAVDLAFDSAELAALADAFEVAHDEHDIAQLLHDTEGWPVAAQWIVRDAAETGRRLRDAFNRWCERNGHLLLEFVSSERHEDADAFASFQRLLRGGGEDRFELDRLEQVGLPLVRTRSAVRPYRILARLSAPAGSAEPETAATSVARLMMLNVLGRFRCEIGGRPVVFARRRDEHVFVFVALAAEGRTTRERLLQAFWPGTDRRVAAQGLRITLSRIRRSISEAVPDIDPRRYFDTAGDIRLDLTAVAVDARRFMDHVEQGRLDDAIGAVEGAKHHYRSAHRIYRDHLLAMEAPERCFARDAESLRRNNVFALTRLTELYAALGDLATAREYARELIACNAEDARRHALEAFAEADAATA
ncbi:MAG: BTAD domain-containing putative transcriptional regulator [Candidatus Velthaea sp.]